MLCDYDLSLIRCFSTKRFQVSVAKLNYLAKGQVRLLKNIYISNFFRLIPIKLVGTNHNFLIYGGAVHTGM